MSIWLYFTIGITIGIVSVMSLGYYERRIDEEPLDVDDLFGLSFVLFILLFFIWPIFLVVVFIGLVIYPSTRCMDTRLRGQTLLFCKLKWTSFYKGLQVKIQLCDVLICQNIEFFYKSG